MAPGASPHNHQLPTDESAKKAQSGAASLLDAYPSSLAAQRGAKENYSAHRATERASDRRKCPIPQMTRNSSDI